MRLIDITSCYHLFCTGLNADTKECDYKIHGHELAYREVQITVQPSKENAAAVYINNLSKTGPATTSSFYNSIITGYTANQVVVATPFDRFYPGRFVGNYLKTDTLALPHAADNTYWQKTDTNAVFANDFYKYKEYVYYDFRLDSLSPARGIADSLLALPYPTDREGVSRANMRPDAGCYQYHL